MAYNTKAIKKDVNGHPVPQIYNSGIDDFEPLQGANGASRVLLYDVNGNPLLTAANPGIVQLAGSPLSNVVTMQNAATAVGNGTSLPTSGMGVALLAVSGTFTATITFEGQGPDGNWYAVNALNRGTGAISTTATAPGLYEINVRGLTAIRARISSYTSGSVTVKGQAQPIPVENGFTQLTGSYAAIKSAPAVGAKTVTTTAAELFAGASRLANRYAMVVYNESTVPVYWGPSSVTTANGFTLLPGDSVVFQFSPSVATPIYFIASQSASVRVVELA